MKQKKGNWKCDKKNVDGSICGKRWGTCIHKFIPTKFGARCQ